jgi:hypothetical protein
MGVGWGNQPMLNKKGDNEMEEFEKDLAILINKHSIENKSDTPDFVLARYLVKCLQSYESAILKRDEWYYDEKPDELGFIDK